MIRKFVHLGLLGAGLLLMFASRVEATTFYVNISNTVPVSPFTNWPTAATNIQDAIDVSSDGDLVLVTNGVYKSGGQIVYGLLTNRVVVNKAITVQSINGPTKTFIQGNPAQGNSAVRCVYLTNNATISGFTLTNGATRTTGDTYQERSGAGVWCESASGIVTNCVLINNGANNYGGGAYLGTVFNCTLSGNNGGSGGGSGFSTLINCTLTNNSGSRGGGAMFGLLTNCILTKNISSSFGGGSCSNILLKCTLNNNTASRQGGGGAYLCALTNCTLSGNIATNGGGANLGILVGCTLTNNLAGNGGGACSNTLYNCLLFVNSAMTNGGGAFCANLTSCTLNGNSAASYGGGAFYANLTNCYLIRNGASYGGGASGGVCNGCIISNNTAGFFGGGIISNTAINCMIGTSNLNGGSYYSTLTRCSLIWNIGGGSHSDVLDNCLLQFNLQGDGANGSILNNCTVRFNGSGGYSGARNCYTTNCILYHNNSNGGNYQNGPYGSVSYSCTWPLPSGIGNFTNQPLLLDSLHLQSNSPCIDTGINLAAGSVDIDGRPRIVNGTVDVGAAEFQGATIEPFILWLAQYNLLNDGSVDYADSDGDGMNNWLEWLSGTIPTNSTSVFALKTPQITTSNTTISWSSVSNLAYQLQFTTNLIAPAWIDLGIPITATNSSVSTTDAVGAEGQRFYRVRLWP